MLEASNAYTALWTVGAMVVGGGLTHFFRKYTERSDNQAETLPVVAQSIETIKNCIKELKDDSKIFYERTDQHEKELTEIRTLHRVLRCFDKANKA